MIFSNKIEAIKHLREMVSTTKLKLEDVSIVDGQLIVNLPYSGYSAIGLKDAKDFVEACMALAAPKPAASVWVLWRMSILDRAYWLPIPDCVGYFSSMSAAVSARDNIMRIKPYNGGGVWETEQDFDISEHTLGLT